MPADDYITIRVHKRVRITDIKAFARGAGCTVHRLSDGSLAFIPDPPAADDRNVFGFPFPHKEATP